MRTSTEWRGTCSTADSWIATVGRDADCAIMIAENLARGNARNNTFESALRSNREGGCANDGWNSGAWKQSLYFERAAAYGWGSSGAGPELVAGADRRSEVAEI